MPGLDKLDAQRLRRVRILFTDIDDTFSTRGKITPQAYDALWRLDRAGVSVVPVTGRPAGWCDHIARFWPVAAVVGENGGFYFYHDGYKLQRRYCHDAEVRAQFRKKLAAVRDHILEEIPGTAIASDQPYREYDVAIDFCEDVPPLPEAQVIRIKQMFEAAGAHAKISSIHVNGWYGDFDKLSTVHLYVREQLGADLDAEREDFVFCGDSPNDEPMFAFFPLSFGMANVRRFLDMMDHGPAFVTDGAHGEGFCQVVDRILAAKEMSS